ncbi:cell adhesion molecule CEACAM5 [Symphorus nematophorus]
MNGSYAYLVSKDKIPVPSLTQQSPWLDVFPTENVKLSCDMDRSSNWRYTWYKDEQQLKAENAVSFESDSATLSISSASASHRGRYRCSATLKTRHVNSNFSSELTLDVYDTIPRVTLVQNPEHNVMHTGDSVSFNCHINVSSGWEYLWYKDGIQLAESGNSHTIRSVLTQNTGSYRCQTKRNGSTAFLSDQSQNVRLEIKERPQANIDLLTGWSEVFSTDSLVLQCGVQGSSDEWNYTWFKGNEEINLLPSKKHTVTPQDDPEQSLYTCKGIQETKRPFYSKTSDPFKTKNLLLKRRVLLSISGCIVFGIAAVFLGCIILRAIRKPAEDECKTEEPDLFVSMSKLKDRDDTACPLVQYITEAGLNSSPKEGEENGTICSETTPLPITSQEDQAAATETEDAKEENGGLVSFKQ